MGYTSLNDYLYIRRREDQRLTRVGGNAEIICQRETRKGSIRITIKSAKNLIPSPHNIGPNGTILRPYLKLHLYPFKNAKKKTQPVEAGDNLSPCFDATFHFKVRVLVKVNMLLTYAI